MKKFVIATMTSIALLTGGAAFAGSDEGSSFGSKFTMLKMFAQYHNLSDHQQSLMKDLFKSGRTLAHEVKKPKAEVKEYLQSIIEQDQIDVDAVMAAYLEWQQGVNQQFEQTLRVAADLHADLSVEQRKQIVESLKDMSKKR